MKRYLLLLFSAFLISCNDNSLNIVVEGTSDYQIAIKDEAAEIEKSAALALQNYLEEISGVQLPIVHNDSKSATKNQIFIGVQKDSLDPQEINIVSDKQNIYIYGGSAMASKYAVYEFLERYLGCKWYAPKVDNIPVSTTISLEPMDYRYSPEIATRTVHSRLFYQDSVFADKQRVSYDAFPNYVPVARVHTFHRFIPEEKFYKTYPEYYALRDNKRLPTQLCLTNPAVLEIVKDSVASLFLRYPNASVISVSQDDNQQYCECGNCSKIDKEEGSHSGTMVRFVNSIAASFPNKTISTLAYQHTRKPCKTKPADNVLITLCSIECDRSGPIEEKCTDFAEDLKGWAKLTDNIRIWDYTTQFTNFLAPFPNLHTLKPNIDFFRDNGTKWIFEQHSNNPSELFELRSYLMAKLLWNPDLDIDTLITEFTNGYYGKAGPYIEKYVDTIHAELEKDKDFFLFLYGDPSEAFDSFLNPDALADYSKLFDEAEKAVANSPEILQRVKTAKLGVDYAVLEACRKGVSEAYNLKISGDDGKITENPEVRVLLDNFKNTCAEANITLMNEMGFTVDEYHASYKKALDVSKRPNKASGKNVIALTKPKKYADENPLVLTDGALGGNSFFANWLGFEGNDMEVVVDLGSVQEVNTMSTAFLQVTNHVVFFPLQVAYFSSLDGRSYTKLGSLDNKSPLTKTSKVNDIQYFDLEFTPTKARYIKVKAVNMDKAPYWHHAAGLPSWIFADEIIID